MSAIGNQSLFKSYVEGEWLPDEERELAAATKGNDLVELEHKRRVVRERMMKRMEQHLARITLAKPQSNEEKLRAYRKNARESMSQMQKALEKKNRLIAELQNEAAFWFAEVEKLRVEKATAVLSASIRSQAGFWASLGRILKGRR